MNVEKILENFLLTSTDIPPLFDLFNSSLCMHNDTLCFNNTFPNVTRLEDGSEYKASALETFVMVITSIVLGLMILVTIIGNVFVIAAILLDKNLQNVANYLIVSLAVADLMVACLVMPLGAVYVISQDWILGPELCDMWTSCDVLCCTASILHLVAIAVDRYWAVTDIDYIHKRNVKKIGAMILLVWTVALIVSLAPQFGWKDPEYLTRINEQKCLVSQDVAYQIFATCSTFYVPLFIILILYWKIFQTARRRIRKNRRPAELSIPLTTITPAAAPPEPAANPRTLRSFLPKISFGRGTMQEAPGTEATAAQAPATPSVVIETQPSTTIEIVVHSEASTSEHVIIEPAPTPEPEEQETAFTISGNPDAIEEAPEPETARPRNNPDETVITVAPPTPVQSSGRSGVAVLNPQASTSRGPLSSVVRYLNPVQAQREKKESLEAKRERKAAKTLAIITGAFVICWLPFFITAILTPLAGPISDHLANFILWLGYFNSTLNPVIYTVFSPEFRQAFKRILFGRRRGNSRFRFGFGR